MPGATDNPDLLSAQNQTIQALNDIERAIRELNLCCYNIDTEPPLTGPNEPVPPGASLPTGDIEARRCKVAIFLIDYLRQLTYTLDVLQFEAVFGVGISLEISAIVGMVTAGLTAIAAALFGGPIPAIWAAVIGSVPGALIGQIISYNQGPPDLTAIVGVIDEKRDELICALANSSNGFVAKSALAKIFVLTGLDIPDLLYLDKVMTACLIQLLFFVYDNFPEFETYIDNLPDPCPCLEVLPVEPPAEEDLDYKCKAANYIVDSLENTLAGWGNLSSFSFMSPEIFINSLTEGMLEYVSSGIIYEQGIAPYPATFVSHLSEMAVSLAMMPLAFLVPLPTQSTQIKKQLYVKYMSRLHLAMPRAYCTLA